jgi:outer membrane protein TolC
MTPRDIAQRIAELHPPVGVMVITDRAGQQSAVGTWRAEQCLAWIDEIATIVQVALSEQREEYAKQAATEAAELAREGREGLEATIHSLRQRVAEESKEKKRLKKVIEGALGEDPDEPFPAREPGQDAYWWRKELRKRAGAL